MRKLRNLLFYIRGFSSFGEIRLLEKADILLFCHDFTRNYEYEGLKYSSLVDTFTDYFKENGFITITLARPYSQIPLKDSYGKVFKVNGGFARARMIDLIISKISFLKNNNSIGLNAFQRHFWKTVLDIIQPKVILGVEPVWEFASAARVKNIPVFDIQHGLISGPPMAHFYKLNYRPENQMGWPNFIICRDIQNYLWLCRERAQFTEPLLVGHPWLARFSGNNQNDKLVQSIKKNNYFKTDKPIILITLQHLRDKNGVPNSFTPIPSSLEKVMLSEYGHSFYWLVRLHPILLSEPNYSHVSAKLHVLYGKFSHIDWHNSSKAPLPFVLSQTCIHFTRNSSTTSEAAEFGINTGIMDLPANYEELKELFKYEIEQGIAEIISVNDEKEVRMFIEKSLLKKHPLNNDFDLIRQQENINKLIKIIVEFLSVLPNQSNFSNKLKFQLGTESFLHKSFKKFFS